MSTQTDFPGFAPREALDELYEMFEGNTDALCFVRDDLGAWWAMCRAEMPGGNGTHWFSVSQAAGQTLDAQHSEMLDAMGGRS